MALFTTSEIKEFLGITTTQYDTLLGNIAERISEVCSLYTRRALEAPTSSETIYLDGTGYEYLYLPNYPIISLTSVKVSSTRDFDDTDPLTEGEDYLVYSDAGILKRIWITEGIWASDSVVWDKGSGNIQVIYKAGYETIPNDLKHAAILWGAQVFIRRGTQGIQSQTMGGYTSSYLNDLMPPETREILARYRRPPMRMWR